jgi:D-beta-D-heptose 7-phosphate kinase/D-beta-D-heptose 1-phosphate adenosyltransferase
MATLALALGAGGSFEEATVLANHAAGVVVGKLGTATVTAAELLAAIGEPREAGGRSRSVRRAG